MIRIQGIPIVAERLQAAYRAASQPAGRFPCKTAMAAHTSARNEVRSGVGVDLRTPKVCRSAPGM